MSRLRPVVDRGKVPNQKTLSYHSLAESRCQGDKKGCVLYGVECISAFLIFHKDIVIYSGYLTVVSHIHIGQIPSIKKGVAQGDSSPWNIHVDF